MLTMLERTIAAVAARCLRTDVPVAADTPFELLGLDSLATIELAAALEAELGCDLPADLLLECRNARLLAARLARDGITRAVEDPFEQMLADAVLPDDVWPAARVRASTDLRNARTILITGATGFLGGALVTELLAQTSARLLCLVRDPGRLQPGRVVPLPGDLTHPRLGLSRARYDALAGDVDAIVHCGAAVNWVFSYAGLRNANVLGTLELLRLACRAGAAFHFVSSLSACYAADGPRVADETFDALPHIRGVYLGYAQTKVVGESLVQQAGARGLPVRIYRPALISGHSQTGGYNRDDLLATLVRGCVAMRTAPDLDWKLDAQPVDVVAKSILELSKADGPTFHIAHKRPRHWRECVLWIRMYGYDVRLVSYPAWLRQLDRETTASPAHPLRPLRAFFNDRPAGAHGLTLPELYEERRRTTAVCERSRGHLEAAGVRCPPLDASLLDKYFAAFIAGNDLPEPSSARTSALRNLERARRSHERPGIPMDTIAGALEAFGHSPRHIEILSTGSEHSIISELTAWRSRRPSGLFRARLTLADDSPRDVMVKLKAPDGDVIAVGEALADIVDPSVGDAYRRWGHQTGLAASHAREIAIYRQQDARFRAHTPEVLATVADDVLGVWMAILEYVGPEGHHDDRVRRHRAHWSAPQIASAIDGLGELQSIWLGRDAELRARPWLGHVHSSESMTEMADLWSALADHAAPFFSAWADPDLVGIHRKLVARIPEWWRLLDAGPRTLIHNDFNPRNVCLRGPDATLCAYDWELATLGAPQRDLAELLCFVLPPNASARDVWQWVEQHRVALSTTSGAGIDAQLWMEGFRSALCDVLINRLAIYCVVNRVRPQSFLPRVVRTWRQLYRHIGPEGPA